MIPLPYKILGIVLAALALLVAGFTAGVKITGNAYKAKQLEAELAQADFNKKTLEGWAAAVQAISDQREAERQQADADRRDFQRRLDDAKRNPQTLARCAQPGAAHDAAGMAGAPGDVRLTDVFVGLYNDGLDTGMPAALGAWRTDGGRAGADPAQAAGEGRLGHP